MNIGEYIKKSREKKGLSINQLALYSNVSAAHISRIEHSLRKPTPHILKKISLGLKLSYEELMEIAGYLDAPKSVSDIKFNHFHNQSLSYLLGEDEAKSLPLAETSTTYLTHLKEPTLNKQDREELKRDAEYIKNAMMNVTGLAFNNKPQDDETLEKVIAALEEAMILARKEAQKKYTPKKYRKKED